MNEIDYWHSVAAALDALLPLLAMSVAGYLVLRILWLISKALLLLAVVVLVTVAVISALH
jgi:hypothetical protein